MHILDSHVHFWQPNTLRYLWLDGFTALNKPFLPDDLIRDSGNLELAGLIYVQSDCLPEQSLQEVDWVSKMTSAIPIRGIIPFAPLELGDKVEGILEQYATYPLVKGIRRLIQSEGLGFATQANFIKGIRLLAKYRLSFDICVKHHQLEDVIELVKQCPDVRFVVDHIGKPDIAHCQLDPWSKHIHTLATFQNVFIKMSGLVTEANPQHWTRDDLRPFIDQVIDAFGTDRIMFGSDWPLCTLVSSYQEWFDILSWATESLNSREKQALFFENARNFYRVD